MSIDSEFRTLVPLDGAGLTEAELNQSPLTDAELTSLAMAADPDAPLSDDAIPLSLHLAQFAGAALPQWYMAPAGSPSGRRWRTPVVVTIIAAFLLIEALGLCNTFGQLSFA
jgi:hypothetical protein